MSGAGKFLKEKKPGILNVAVDPIGSIYKGMFETGKVGHSHVYKVEGIGEDRVCEAMDFSVVDEVRQDDDRKSFYWARRLTREEGLFAGGSSGAAVASPSSSRRSWARTSSSSPSSRTRARATSPSSSTTRG
jgi:cystathionine beta-synthase